MWRLLQSNSAIDTGFIEQESALTPENL